jgi:hypothetical protein
MAQKNGVKQEKKRGFLSGLMEKLDKKMEEKAQKSSCCGGGSGQKKGSSCC